MRELLARLFSFISRCCYLIVILGVVAIALSLGPMRDDPLAKDLGDHIIGTAYWLACAILTHLVAYLLTPKFARGETGIGA